MFRRNSYVFRVRRIDDNKEFVLKMKNLNYDYTLYDYGVVGAVINYMLNLFYLKHKYNNKEFPICENFVRLEDVKISKNYFREPNILTPVVKFSGIKENYIASPTERIKESSYVQTYDKNFLKFKKKDDYDIGGYKRVQSFETSEQLLVQMLEQLDVRGFENIVDIGKKTIKEKEPIIGKRTIKEKEPTIGKRTIKDLKILFLQLIYALKCGKEWFGFEHKDLHYQNVMGKRIMPLQDLFIGIPEQNLYYKIKSCPILIKTLDFELSMVYKDDLTRIKTMNPDKEDFLHSVIIKKSLEDETKLRGSISNMYRSNRVDMIHKYRRMKDLVNYFHFLFTRKVMFRKLLLEYYPKLDDINVFRDFIYNGILGGEKDIEIVLKFMKGQSLSMKNLNRLLNLKMYEQLKTKPRFVNEKIKARIKKDLKSPDSPYFASLESKDFDTLLQHDFFKEFRINKEQFDDEISKTKSEYVYIYRKRTANIDFKDYKKYFTKKLVI